jgi:hypothetical protein
MSRVLSPFLSRGSACRDVRKHLQRTVVFLPLVLLSVTDPAFPEATTQEPSGSREWRWLANLPWISGMTDAV